MINIALTKDALRSNFELIINGKLSSEDIGAYATSKAKYVSWKCRSCGTRGKGGEWNKNSKVFFSTLIERANAHWYCRCTRHQEMIS